MEWWCLSLAVVLTVASVIFRDRELTQMAMILFLASRVIRIENTLDDK